MAPTNDPLRLQIVDRFVEVLELIEAGANYFFTPHKVAKFPLDFEQSKYGPLYQVFPGSEEGDVIISGRENYDETFYVTVIGFIHDLSDLVSKLEKALRDVRRAIDVDSKSEVAGTLGVLAVQVRIDTSPLMSYYAVDRDGFGQFEQKCRVQITGDFGDL